MKTAQLRILNADDWVFRLDGGERIDLFIRPEEPAAPADSLDAPLVASLLYWMSQPVDELRIDGPVSSTLLVNLNELQRCWARWRPRRYAPVRLVAEAAIDDVAVGEGAVATFSGGVDSAYTLVRNASDDTPPLLRLREAVMVQGFDVGLDERPMYERALERSRRMASAVGVPVRSVQANLRDVLPVSWVDTFGLAVAAVLLTFQTHRRTGLIASGNAYNDLRFPRGSTPVTDWMATTGRMQIRHDGAGASRSDKVAHIADRSLLVDNLRVCWSGADRDGNCGVCEKCLRTMLNFLSTGREVPAAFPTRLAVDAIRGTRITPTALKPWGSLLAETPRSRRQEPWYRAARAMYRRERLRVGASQRLRAAVVDSQLGTAVRAQCARRASLSASRSPWAMFTARCGE